MSDRERILTATSARELFGDAVDDPRLLRRAYAKLAKQFRPDEDAQAFAVLRKWFERARDRDNACLPALSEAPLTRRSTPDILAQVLAPTPVAKISLSQISSARQRVFQLCPDALEDLLVDCDEVGIDLSPDVLDRAEDAILLGLAVLEAQSSERDFGPWLGVASTVFSSRNAALDALRAVAEAYPSYAETRRALTALTDAHPALSSALYRSCALATGSERDWLAFNRWDWTPPEQVLRDDETWEAACQIAANGPAVELPSEAYDLMLGAFAIVLLGSVGLFVAAKALPGWVHNSVPFMAALLGFVLLSLLNGHLRQRHTRLELALVPCTPTSADDPVEDTVDACLRHALWPHEFLALAVRSAHHRAFDGVALRAYSETHPLPILQRDLALIPRAMGEKLERRLRDERGADVG